MQYLPEQIGWTETATNNVQNIKIEVLGEGVIVDLDRDGIEAVCQYQMNTAPTDSLKHMNLTLADGIITGKTVVMTFNGNTGTDATDIFARGNNAGTMYITSNKYTILANNNVELSKFLLLFVPNMADGDKATCSFVDGTVQIYEPTDLKIESAMVQAIPQMVFDNTEQNFDYVQMLVAATQVIYQVAVKMARP